MKKIQIYAINEGSIKAKVFCIQITITQIVIWISFKVVNVNNGNLELKFVWFKANIQAGICKIGLLLYYAVANRIRGFKYLT